MRLNYQVRVLNLKETPQQKPCAVVAGYRLIFAFPFPNLICARL